jgi:hypothetical protein
MKFTSNYPSSRQESEGPQESSSAVAPAVGRSELDAEEKELLRAIDRRLMGVERGVRAGKRSMRGLELAMIEVMNKLGGAIHDTRSRLGLGPWHPSEPPKAHDEQEETPHDSPSEKMRIEFEEFSRNFPDDEGNYKVKMSDNPDGSRVSVEGDDPAKVKEILAEVRKRRHPVIESLRPVGRAMKSRTGKIVGAVVAGLSALAGLVQWLEAHGFLK